MTWQFILTSEQLQFVAVFGIVFATCVPPIGTHVLKRLAIGVALTLAATAYAVLDNNLQLLKVAAPG